MAREQKTRSKASQKAKPRVAPTQVRGQTGASPVPTVTASATSTSGVAAGALPDEAQTTSNTTTTNAPDTTISTQQEQTAVEQSTTGSKQVVWPGWQPNWPSWPTSQPGPRSTPPIAGTRPINAFRSEQFEETDYNQQIGEPAVQRSLPDERTSGPGKGKQRL
jgi:hypothetical protein